jgi:hypothetical protein
MFVEVYIFIKKYAEKYQNQLIFYDLLNLNSKDHKNISKLAL